MRKNILARWRRQTRAFTLIELLVVIAIIGILAGMLLPALNKAREKGNAAKCVSNMHQWALAMNMYNDDWKEYYPYVGDTGSPCDSANLFAWYNALPPYIGQKTLCQLYTAPSTPPNPRANSIWVCPSATNKTVNPTTSNPIFWYSINDCTHSRASSCGVKSTYAIYRRDRMISPPSTIIFCEEPEDNYSETSGGYETVTRHSGGANFVMGDGHVEWILPTLYCRQCAPFPFQWDDSSTGGDWKKGTPYHWWFAQGISEMCN
ncbi:MAG TPA: prepilin-type N-terminal cleavage/methylation domain-containing protein [Verrucomicrobiae bacterium]|nr:prepilin-type N-terminal cleavage/methylation domain-containing protein [Verrucomicrobiae bacterium]